jgi:hypothetical protein
MAVFWNFAPSLRIIPAMEGKDGQNHPEKNPPRNFQCRAARR